MLSYLLAINIVAAGLFIMDKLCGRLSLMRVPEFILHLAEILGGVFAIFLLIPILNHKTAKPKYWVITFMIFLGWTLRVLFYD